MRMNRRLAAVVLTAVLALCATALPAVEGGGVLPSIHSRSVHLQLPRPPEVPSDAELEAAGATIGRVEVIIDNVFDTTNPEENKALPRVANRLHIRTRQSTIEGMLLFHAGEPYSARALEESERVLRSTR